MSAPAFAHERTAHTGALALATAATHGYTLAFTGSAALLGLGVILAVAPLPAKHRLEELRNAAPAAAPAPTPATHAIPVARSAAPR